MYLHNVRRNCHCVFVCVEYAVGPGKLEPPEKSPLFALNSHLRVCRTLVSVFSLSLLVYFLSPFLPCSTTVSGHSYSSLYSLSSCPFSHLLRCHTASDKFRRLTSISYIFLHHESGWSCRSTCEPSCLITMILR